MIINKRLAYKKYAKAIGVKVRKLSKTQRQQAILNAIFEQSKKEFEEYEQRKNT